MRAVLQRVLRAAVEVEGKVAGEIGPGLLALVGVSRGDTEEDAVYLAKKIAGLRIFSDNDRKMNRNVVEAGGSLLVVSQFTLYADTAKGMRPSFDGAAPPEVAQPLYNYLVAQLRDRVPRVETGVFRASMTVSLVNDGPVTVICDSPEKLVTW